MTISGLAEVNCQELSSLERFRMVMAEITALIHQESAQQFGGFEWLACTADRMPEKLPSAEGVLVLWAQDTGLLLRDLAQCRDSLLPVTILALLEGCGLALPEYWYGCLRWDGRLGECSVPGYSEQPGSVGAALVRHRQALGFHPAGQLPVYVINRQEFRATGYPIAEQPKQPPRKCGIFLTRQDQSYLVRLRGGEYITAAYLDLPDEITDGICHNIA